MPRSRRYLAGFGVLLMVLAVGAPAFAAIAQSADSGQQPVDQPVVEQLIPIPLIWWLAPAGSVLALVFAWIFYRQVMAADEGDADMQIIAAHVRDGAMAYLRRQYKVVLVFFIVVSALLALMSFGFHVQHALVPFAFLTGGFFSGLCGFLGMKTATNAAHRTTAAARKSLNGALVVAFRAGAVMGMVVVGFGLLDITGWFLVLAYVAPKFFNVFIDLTTITVVMLCFGMGASAQALFARVGGGIFTKAADVGADLVGKIEAGIPEDDPRNPATIADNVGDNVGDVAGMGADLYESYCGSILATAALGVAAASALKLDTVGAMRFLSAPMVLAGVGIVLSILGIYLVRTKEGATMKNLLRALLTGVMGSSLLIAVAAAAVCHYLFGPLDDVNAWGIWGSIMAGLAAGLVIGQATEYYTSYDYKPTQDVARHTETGPGTVIIAGIAEGMKSTWVALATIIVAIMLAFGLAGGFTEFTLGVYGVGIAAVGMLATLGITLATDAYGPIADNAGGNAEMTHQDPEVRRRTDALDSLGNTTAATGKGFAIGSAALTALALLAAYVEEVRVGQNRQAQTYVSIHQVDDLSPDQAIYIGHEKLVGIDEDGEVFAYMALDSRQALADLPVGSRLTGLSAEDERSIRTCDQGDHRLRLVSATNASMSQYMSFYNVTLMNPRGLCGIFSGVLLAFVFSALTMKAVARAANRMVLEVRRQFLEIPGLLEGTAQPEYAKCVAISTAGAQREMIFPSLMALIVPVLVGLLFGVGGVMGLLVGGLSAGFALAIFMANAGGSWDNAKKWIEAGQLGGKGSDNHKAAIVGDTVGDPFKDTSGPSLNILIKLMSMVSVVFAGLIVKFAPIVAQWLGIH